MRALALAAAAEREVELSARLDRYESALYSRAGGEGEGAGGEALALLSGGGGGAPAGSFLIS